MLCTYVYWYTYLLRAGQVEYDESLARQSTYLCMHIMQFKFVFQLETFKPNILSCQLHSLHSSSKIKWRRKLSLAELLRINNWEEPTNRNCGQLMNYNISHYLLVQERNSKSLNGIFNFNKKSKDKWNSWFGWDSLLFNSFHLQQTDCGGWIILT